MWKFERLMEHDIANTTHMVFDGRDVWVGDNTANIKVLTYWDSRTDEHDIVNDPLFPNVELQDQKGLVEVGTVNLSAHSSTINQMVKVYDKIFTYGDCKLISIDINTKEINTFVLPSGVNPTSILSANNKVWIVSTNTNFNRDTLCFYDTLTDQWSAQVAIPGVTQTKPRDMVWAHDGYVIVAGFNDNSVHKFDSTSGAFVDTTHVNRKPQALTANDTRQVIVGSYNGMVSSYNQTTNFVNHTDGILDEATGIVDDGTYLWCISPYLSRKKKNQTVDALRLQSLTATHPKGGEFTGEEGYALESFGDDSFKQILITPEFDYEYWNGTSFEQRTVKQYVFLLADNKVYAFRNMSLYRENFISVRATGMIAVGESGYFGETR